VTAPSRRFARASALARDVNHGRDRAATGGQYLPYGERAGDRARAVLELREHVNRSRSRLATCSGWRGGLVARRWLSEEPLWSTAPAQAQKIASVNPEPTTVYNLESRSFTVTSLGRGHVLVHNGDPGAPAARKFIRLQRQTIPVWAVKGKSKRLRVWEYGIGGRSRWRTGLLLAKLTEPVRKNRRCNGISALDPALPTNAATDEQPWPISSGATANVTKRRRNTQLAAAGV